MCVSYKLRFNSVEVHNLQGTEVKSYILSHFVEETEITLDYNEDVCM